VITGSKFRAQGEFGKVPITWPSLDHDQRFRAKSRPHATYFAINFGITVTTVPRC
jgi:hypothetical protein